MGHTIRHSPVREIRNHLGMHVCMHDLGKMKPLDRNRLNSNSDTIRKVRLTAVNWCDRPCKFDRIGKISPERLSDSGDRVIE
jgi:hypothetical protein